MVSSNVRLPATVDEFACWWLWKLHGDRLRADARSLRERGGVLPQRLDELDQSLDRIEFVAVRWEHRNQRAFASERTKTLPVKADASSMRPMTAKEAAAVLGLTPQRIGQLCKALVLASELRGGRRFIERGSVELLAQERKERAS